MAVGFSRPIQSGPKAHPASCRMGTGSLSWVERGRGMVLTTHPLLASRLSVHTAILLPLHSGCLACVRTHTHTHVHTYRQHPLISLHLSQGKQGKTVEYFPQILVSICAHVNLLSMIGSPEAWKVFKECRQCWLRLLPGKTSMVSTCYLHKNTVYT